MFTGSNSGLRFRDNIALGDGRNAPGPRSPGGGLGRHGAVGALFCAKSGAEMTTTGADVSTGSAKPARSWQPGLHNIGGAAGTGTTPGKLRVILTGLVAVSALWGAVCAWTVAAHASAAENVLSVSEPLSVDGEHIYRSLSDADATEADAFLSGGLEPFALRARYQSDIARAASALEAATAAAGNSTVAAGLTTLAAGLPIYTGLVETARADNRLGLPLGAAYLREASGYLRGTLLPAARRLYATENAEVAAADRQATALPYFAIGVAVIGALALALSQQWLARRSRRLLNPGLLVASLAAAASIIWLVSALTLTRVHLIAARDQGSAPVEALAVADIAVLEAHADESLTLIDRSGDDSFQRDFLSIERSLGPGNATLLTRASVAAQGSPGARQADVAARVAHEWFAIHRRVRSLDDSGSYTAAVNLAIGTAPTDSGGMFDQLDANLTAAIAVDQASFRSAAAAGHNDLSGLEAGMIVLSVVMVAGCAWGISRRLGEYR